MSRHVNDAGLINSDKQVLIQLMAEVRSANPDSSLVVKVTHGAKNMAFRSLDSGSLSDLLKRKN
jgi:hypothetical protein